MGENDDERPVRKEETLEEVIEQDNMKSRLLRGAATVGKRLVRPLLFTATALAFGAGAAMGWDMYQNYRGETIIMKSVDKQELIVDRYGRLIVHKQSDIYRVLSQDSEIPSEEEEGSDDGESIAPQSNQDRQLKSIGNEYNINYEGSL
jgi:hypothetical protein